MLVLVGLAVGCGGSDADRDKKSQGGIKYEDLKEGEGPEVKPGDWVKVDYTGWLEENGKTFDTSRKPGRKPLVFQVGLGKVIKGWDEGLVGMKVGGRRKLYIPSELAYGARGAGKDIPPNANLVFDVELVSIEKDRPADADGE